MRADSDPRAADSVEAVFREEHGRLLAALTARLGDLDLAEDVAQEALEAAIVRWPVDGVPRSPLAWLLTTARRKAVDRIRRDARYATRLAELAADADRARPSPVAVVQSADELPDERLTLFFTCCHPALPQPEQVALTLRCLAGLTTPEVSAALLVPVPAMQQRLVRAKRKISRARIPFRMPSATELPDRLDAVLTVVYLLFSEGYAASGGEALIRSQLTDEAIRLARVLHRLLPGHPEPAGLLALMLLTDARRPARLDGDGLPVSLADQDRRLWDADSIREGRRLLAQARGDDGGDDGGASAARRAPQGPYTVQAHIAALHDEAPDVASTDWPQIVGWYDVLLQLTGSPVVAVNRAVAVAMRDGAEAGLVLLDRLTENTTLRGYHPLAAARADLLTRLGRPADAADAYRHALSLLGDSPDRTYLARRLAQLPVC